MGLIRLGTRSSRLAVVQAQAVADLMADRGYPVRLVPFETRGDKILDRSLDRIGGKGVFTEELERSLIRGSVDVAVHSLKDLPTELPDGLEIGAWLLPEDRRDVLIARRLTLAELPAGTRIGTSSLRRQAFLRAQRPDLAIVPVRGNLDTRLQHWQEGRVDGLVLAAAGVIRLGRSDLISEYFDPEAMVPSPGQGILAVEVATHRRDLLPLLEAINDSRAKILAQAERAVLSELGSGCQVPVGAYAAWTDADHLTIVAQAASLDGRVVLHRRQDCSSASAVAVGQQLGRFLKAKGALDFVPAQRG